MKFIVVSFLLLVGNLVFAEVTANVNAAGVIDEGYDVVSYFKPGGPLMGKPEFQVKVEDVTYWFANESDKIEFQKDPKKYAPQFGGWCAYAVANSKEKVEVDPKSFLIQDGRLLLFYNGVWADTRKKWQNTKGKDSTTYLKEADANWPEVVHKKP